MAPPLPLQLGTGKPRFPRYPFLGGGPEFETDVGALEFAFGGPRIESVDARRGRAAPRPRDYRVDRAWGALQHGLHGSVPPVPDPAGDAVGQRRSAQCVAVADALNASRNPQVIGHSHEREFCHWARVKTFALRDKLACKF